MTDSSQPQTETTQPPPAFPSAPWLPYVLPLGVYMALASFEPGPSDIQPNGFGMTFAHYPIAYTIKIAITIGLLAYVWRGYRQWPLRVSPLAIGVGVVGVVLWVAICGLGIEERFTQIIGPDSDLAGLLGLSPRPSYNPFEQLKHAPALAWAFLVVRFIGLSLVVPVVEEMLLRGWLMRNLSTDGYRPNFWQVPFGMASTAAIVVGTAFPMLYHPEKIASLVWFSLVTWLMLRTKNIWDCVAAHAVTNFLLGVWVVWQGAWELW